MYTVKLPIQKGMTPFSGERYGMIFSNGEGQTKSKFIAEKLDRKGLKVIEMKETKASKAKEIEEK